MAFFYELEFDLPTEWEAVPWTAEHPQARVEGARTRIDRRSDGTVARIVGLLLVRDAPHPRPAMTEQVIVVKQTGRIVNLPDWAGKLLSTFTANHGEDVYWVLEMKPQPPAPPASQSASPPARSESPAPAPRAPAAPAQAPQAATPAPSEADWLADLS